MVIFLIVSGCLKSFTCLTADKTFLCFLNAGDNFTTFNRQKLLSHEAHLNSSTYYSQFSLALQQILTKYCSTSHVTHISANPEHSGVAEVHGALSEEGGLGLLVPMSMT